ncbi:hypothetical protein F4778DRAFT_542075 [Xylariomycetidae sp. FL2044]|nr:hypothetical protein F4778DRAFT_542075 [Xylariomycetidae sp. FL2044]
MNKMAFEESFTWLGQAYQSNLLSAEISTVVRWIAFFFKVASLAFALPILSLIVFDFCLWIWRLLNRPPPPSSSSPPPPPHEEFTDPEMRRSSAVGSGATAVAAKIQKRVGHSRTVDD